MNTLVNCILILSVGAAIVFGSATECYVCYEVAQNCTTNEVPVICQGNNPDLPSDEYNCLTVTVELSTEAQLDNGVVYSTIKGCYPADLTCEEVGQYLEAVNVTAFFPPIVGYDCNICNTELCNSE